MRVKRPFFSAPHHASWLAVSVFMFVIGVSRLLAGETDASGLFLALHGIIAMNALSALEYGRKKHADLYTTDCIWFNIFMAQMHGLSLIMFKLAKSPVGL